MSTSYQVKSTTHIDEATTKKQDRSVFVLQLHSGQIVVGSAANPCKRIAAINSGLSPEVAKPLQVNRILGIKPMTADRKIYTVFRHFEQQYGEGNVIAVWPMNELLNE